MPIKFIDTAGWEATGTENSKEMIEKMMSQTRQALFESDLAFFILDVRQGVTVADEKLADYLKGEGIRNYPNLKNIVLLGNKAEQSFLGDITNEVYKLGMGDPLYISAEHNEGIVDLYDKLRECIPESYIEENAEKYQKRIEKHEELRKQKWEELQKMEKKSGEDWNLREWEKVYDELNHPDNSDYDSDAEVDLQNSLVNPEDFKLSPEAAKRARPIQMSIIGRPNVGKSSLVNSILNSDRVITDSKAGTTRDSVSIDYLFNGRKIKLVDTAGLYKRSKGVLNELIEDEVHRTIKYSHVVFFMFDASEGIYPSELDLAREVINEGRVLIAVGNKWDKVSKDLKQKFIDYYTDMFFRKISLKGLYIIFTSASTKYNVKNLLNETLNLYDAWNTRISTGLLNRWLDSFKKVQSLPTEHGSLLKIKYITQIKARPPTFYVFVNDKSLMKENYYKIFTNSLCREFKLNGVPTRIIFRDKHLKAKKIHQPGFNVRKVSKLKTSGLDLMKKKSRSKRPM